MAIVLSFFDEHIGHVSDASIEMEIWNASLSVLERHTLLDILVAWRRLYTVTMQAGEKTIPYSNRAKQHAGTRKSMNCRIHDDKSTMAALSGLASSFDRLNVIHDALGNDDNPFTLDT